MANCFHHKKLDLSSSFMLDSCSFNAPPFFHFPQKQGAWASSMCDLLCGLGQGALGSYSLHLLLCLPCVMLGQPTAALVLLDTAALSSFHWLLSPPAESEAGQSPQNHPVPVERLQLNLCLCSLLSNPSSLFSRSDIGKMIVSAVVST